MSDDKAFSQALVRGLGQAPAVAPTAVMAGGQPASSQLTHGQVAQKHGDPNYYATAPVYDTRGFWHAAGTNPPALSQMIFSEFRRYIHGTWTQRGTVTRNGRNTTFWVLYPPASGVYVVSAAVLVLARGVLLADVVSQVSHGAYVSRSRIGAPYIVPAGKRSPLEYTASSQTKIFSNPDYWAAKFFVNVNDLVPAGVVGVSK